MKRFDVVIIGAGPAGCSSAISLARRGYSVALIDKELFPREKICGDFLNPINWPVLKELGVAEEILALEHEKVTAFRITSFTGAEAVVPLPSDEGRPSFGLGLSRYLLDHLLLKKAESIGVVVYQGYRVRDLKSDNGWSLTIGKDSARIGLRSALLIGADGRNSWVAQRLGLARRGEIFPKRVAFQVRLQAVRPLNREVEIHLFPGGYAGLVGLGQGIANLCFAVERDKIERDLSIEALLENVLSRNQSLRQTLERSEIVERIRSAFPLYFRPRRSFGERLLLVGDAARVTEPVTGEGVFFALTSGALAADAIDQAFIKSDFSSRQLFHYRRACQRAFSWRQRLNGLICVLVHRPRLAATLIQISSKTSFPMHRLVRSVCNV